MKTKHLGLLGACVLAIGSYSVFAIEPAKTTPVMNTLPPTNIAQDYTLNTSTSDASTSSDTTLSNKDALYNNIKDMIDSQVASGNLTESEAQEMLDYCINRMSNNSNGRGLRSCH